MQVSHRFEPDSRCSTMTTLCRARALVPVMELASQTSLIELLDGKIHIAEPRVPSGSANPPAKAGHGDRGHLCRHGEH